MAVRIARRRHSVAFFDADRADDLAFFGDNVVLAGLGRDFARCQLIHLIFLLYRIMSKLRVNIRTRTRDFTYGKKAVCTFGEYMSIFTVKMLLFSDTATYAFTLECISAVNALNV